MGRNVARAAAGIAAALCVVLCAAGTPAAEKWSGGPQGSVVMTARECASEAKRSIDGKKIGKGEAAREYVNGAVKNVDVGNVEGMARAEYAREGEAGGGDSGEGENRQVVISMGETAETIYISWKGGEDGPGQLKASQEPGRLSGAASIEAARLRALKGRYYRYTVELRGLSPDTVYWYTIGDGAEFDKPRYFRTPPSLPSPERMLYLGDIQFENSLSDYDRWGSMTEAIMKRHSGIQLAVIGGDMVNAPGAAEQWEAFLKNCRALEHIPVTAVSGNHEGVTSNETYKKMLEAPRNGPDIDALKEEFYYVDTGICRFIMTDSSFLEDERREAIGEKEWDRRERAIEKWLKQTISESDKVWNIAVIHHPPYGMHDKDTVSPRLRELWSPILEAAGTDLVLCGHQHMYMRTKKINGIVYIMGNSGQRRSEFYNGRNEPDYCAALYGAGENYQLIDADTDSLRVTSYNEKGLIVDEAVVPKALWFHILEFFGSH